jgi:dynein heavy chain
LQAPVIWLRPWMKDELPEYRCFECPLYKTSERKGTLSTSGHSTNFVLAIKLPIAEEHNTAHWVRRGVAMLTMLDD